MCKEDMREGRKKYSRASTVTMANGVSTPLVTDNADRTHLTIVSSSAGCRIAPAGQDATGFGAFTVGATLPPLDFDVQFHGDIVMGGWNGSGNGGAFNVLVIETFWSDKG